MQWIQLIIVRDMIKHEAYTPKQIFQMKFGVCPMCAGGLGRPGKQDRGRSADKATTTLAFPLIQDEEELAHYIVTIYLVSRLL